MLRRPEVIRTVSEIGSPIESIMPSGELKWRDAAQAFQAADEIHIDDELYEMTPDLGLRQRDHVFASRLRSEAIDLNMVLRAPGIAGRDNPMTDPSLFRLGCEWVRLGVVCSHGTAESRKIGCKDRPDWVRHGVAQ